MWYSSAQRRLPDFTASTRLSDKFKMADIADDATVTRFSKHKIQVPYNKKKQTATKTKTKSYAFPKQETTRNQRKIINQNKG